MGHHHVGPPGIGAAHLQEPLHPHVGEGCRHVVAEVAQRGRTADDVLQAAGHVGAERLPGHVLVGAAALDEVHRHVQQPLDVALEAEPLLEHQRRHPGPGVVHVRPHPGAAGQQAARLALDERRVGEQRRRHRLQRQRHAQLAGHVGLAGVVQVHLHGAGPQHHVQAVLPDQGHVAAHDGIAALGHPRHLVPPQGGMEAQRREADAQRLRHGADGGEVGVELRRGVVQGR